MNIFELSIDHIKINEILSTLIILSLQNMNRNLIILN